MKLLDSLRPNNKLPTTFFRCNTSLQTIVTVEEVNVHKSSSSIRILCSYCTFKKRTVPRDFRPFLYIKKKICLNRLWTSKKQLFDFAKIFEKFACVWCIYSTWYRIEKEERNWRLQLTKIPCLRSCRLRGQAKFELCKRSSRNLKSSRNCFWLFSRGLSVLNKKIVENLVELSL